MIVRRLHVKGHIIDDKLIVELPDNAANGEVILQVPVEVDEPEPLLEERPLVSDGSGPCADDPYYLDSAVIVQLMRTSIWDMIWQIKRDLAED
jgi:hypothetical protein